MSLDVERAFLRSEAALFLEASTAVLSRLAPLRSDLFGAGRRRHVLVQASPQAARNFADDALDFAFIDGNHLYESVQGDIFAWWPKIRAGGLLAGHDYGVYGDANGKWGVRRAVDEFAAALRCGVDVGRDGVWSVRK